MIILDANILVAALIKNSVIRQILLKHKEFAVTNYVLEEVNLHIETIIQQADLTDEAPSQILKILLSNIQLILDEELDAHFEEATEIVKSIDQNDDHIVAAALANPGSSIWSEDKALKKQNKVKVMNTKEMIEYFSKLEETETHNNE